MSAGSTGLVVSVPQVLVASVPWVRWCTEAHATAQPDRAPIPYQLGLDRAVRRRLGRGSAVDGVGVVRHARGELAFAVLLQARGVGAFMVDEALQELRRH